MIDMANVASRMLQITVEDSVVEQICSYSNQKALHRDLTRLENQALAWEKQFLLLVSIDCVK